ncbi:MAG TPA: hypothetical protein VMW67_07035 [Desulfobacteria bacterium]|nr:hypothetical protein [Desulfobacteria bacterium]
MNYTITTSNRNTDLNFPPFGERNKIMKYLDRKGFDPILIEDASDYTVKVGRFKKYAAILRNSIDYEEKGEVRIFGNVLNFVAYLEHQ